MSLNVPVQLFPLKCFTTLFSISVAGVAFATPSVSPKCQPKEIVATKNGAGVLFDEHCTTAYVLPPVTGKAEVTALAQSANLQFCPSQLQVGDIATSTTDSAGRLAAQLKLMIDGFKPQSDELEELRKDSASLKADLEIETESFKSTKSKDSQLMGAIDAAAMDFKQCSKLASDVSQECASQQKALDESKTAYKSFLAEFSEAEERYLTTKRNFTKVSNELNSKTEDLANATKPLFDLQAKLFELNNSVMDLYKQYTPLEGATGQIVYSIPWDQLVQDYKTANPNLAVTWARLPLQDASFWASVRAKTSGDPSLPAVLWSRVPGAKASGPLSGQDGNVSVGASTSVPSSNNISDVAMGFGSSVSGQVSLSLAGACPYFETGPDTSKSAIDFKDFTAHLVGNLNYTYEMKARRGYTAKYNLSNMVSRMEKNTKKGGWFSSSRAHEVVEDNSSSDWFDIQFDADASEFQYTAQEQTEITKDVKAGLIDRALKNMASINGLNSAPPPTPALPETTGVGAAAKSLRGSCYWNYYCLGGAFILSTLDNIFGSTTAVSNFKKSNNVWVEDKVRGVQILERTGGLTFSNLDYL